MVVAAVVVVVVVVKVMVMVAAISYEHVFIISQACALT
jgi:hypothetical protein